jgi:hypothetical protein
MTSPIEKLRQNLTAAKMKLAHARHSAEDAAIEVRLCELEVEALQNAVDVFSGDSAEAGASRQRTSPRDVEREVLGVLEAKGGRVKIDVMLMDRRADLRLRTWRSALDRLKGAGKIVRDNGCYCIPIAINLPGAGS